jgi:aspartate beta-hydroxylase
MFPGLTAKPWHDSRDHPLTKKLIESFSMIYRELETVKRLHAYVPQRGSYAEGGQWNVFRFSIRGHATRHSQLLCPGTSQLISELPGVGEAGMAYFSAMTPGTSITAHCDSSNTLLRCHLGLSIPERCSIRVGNEIRQWEQGSCLVFDGSFEHEVWHRGDKTRWVLIMDFWHPELTTIERRALIRISHFRPAERSIRKKHIRSEQHLMRLHSSIPDFMAEEMHS